MFVLILTIIANGYGITTTTTTGFTSKQNCMAAGRAVEVDLVSRQTTNASNTPSKWEQLSKIPRRAPTSQVSVFYQCPKQ